jgi:hypothetical protein
MVLREAPTSLRSGSIGSIGGWEWEKGRAVYGQLTKDCAVLGVFLFWIRAQHGAKAVVVHLFLVCHHEITPPLLSLRALEPILIYGLGGVKFGKVLAEMLVDLIINLGQTESAALHLFQDCPVRLQVLDSCRAACQSLPGSRLFEWAQCLAAVCLIHTLDGKLLFDLPSTGALGKSQAYFG